VVFLFYAAIHPYATGGHSILRHSAKGRPPYPRRNYGGGAGAERPALGHCLRCRAAKKRSLDIRVGRVDAADSGGGHSILRHSAKGRPPYPRRNYGGGAGAERPALGHCLRCRAAKKRSLDIRVGRVDAADSGSEAENEPLGVQKLRIDEA
jgi:hypothetical protein